MKMKIVLKILFPTCLLLLASGCVSTRHDWGSYENELYTYYKSPTDVERQELINELAEVFVRAEEGGTIPPPGLYAEYGNFLFQAGDLQQAIEYFKKEKAAWPESAKLMDSLVAALEQRLQLQSPGLPENE